MNEVRARKLSSLAQDPVTPPRKERVDHHRTEIADVDNGIVGQEKYLMRDCSELAINLLVSIYIIMAYENFRIL